MASPDEIARSALYLASDASRITAGAALLADGGISVARTWSDRGHQGGGVAAVQPDRICATRSIPTQTQTSGSARFLSLFLLCFSIARLRVVGTSLARLAAVGKWGNGSRESLVGR
ncbi:MAG: hypothetical protein IV085_13620 [Thiobacillus sp.]|nr:hypothetical protein [Thiobacillus sp.]